MRPLYLLAALTLAGPALAQPFGSYDDVTSATQRQNRENEHQRQMDNMRNDTDQRLRALEEQSRYQGWNPR